MTVQEKRQDQLYGYMLCAVAQGRAPCREGPIPDLRLCYSVLKFFFFFFLNRGPHFPFAQGTTNYVACCGQKI